MDPRIFLVLPEHVSNAYNIWNCAWFLAQMSNLAETAQTTKYSVLNNSNNNDENNNSNNNNNIFNN